MYHAVQQPLYVYLDLAPQGEPVKPFMGSDICEYRLHYGHPLRINPSTLCTLDLLYHDLGEVVAIRCEGHC